MTDHEVTVAVPFYGDSRLVQRCVRSLRRQTHRDMRILVIGDGQRPRLYTKDPRVQFYTLPENKGAYFARAVALAATETPFHGVVDADDWVDPEWAEQLLATGGDAVQHGYFTFEEDSGPRLKRWSRARSAVLPRFVHYAPHIGIYTTERLRAAGGYSPAFRMGYDSLLSAVLRLQGPVSIVDEPTYHRAILPDSLSNAEATRIGSPARQRIKDQLSDTYLRAYRARRNPARVREIVHRLTPRALWDEVSEHAEIVRQG